MQSVNNNSIYLRYGHLSHPIQPSPHIPHFKAPKQQQVRNFVRHEDKLHYYAHPIHYLCTYIQPIRPHPKRPALLPSLCLHIQKSKLRFVKTGRVYLQPSYLILYLSHCQNQSLPIHKIVLHPCLVFRIASTLLLSRIMMFPQISLLKSILFHPAHPRTPRINLYTRQ